MEALIQEFLSNTIELCLRRLHIFPRSAREKLKAWAERLASSFHDSKLARTIASALEKLRDETKELADSLAAELEAVVALQRHALQLPPRIKPAKSQVTEADSSLRSVNRGLKASATLLGSLREAVWYLPDWAKGLLKVGEEIIEIFGPAR